MNVTQKCITQRIEAMGLGLICFKKAGKSKSEFTVARNAYGLGVRLLAFTFAFHSFGKNNGIVTAIALSLVQAFIRRVDPSCGV